MDSKDVERVVRETVAAVLGPEPPAGPGPAAGPGRPGVVLVRGTEVSLQRFDGAPGQDVRLADMVTSAHGSAMAAGLMELRESTFAWTLNYEEIEYVLDGTLDIIVGETTYRAYRGDAIFIPRGTAIQFSTPNRALFLYITYPANWAEQ